MDKWFRLGLRAIACGLLVLLVWAAPAGASLNDDRYDGNIFALYGGNGSIVPPRITLAQSLAVKRPALLVYFIDDSADCKLFSPVLNQVQAFYGKSISIIPIPADGMLPTAPNASADEVAYFKGLVPQTVLVDADGQVVYDRSGVTSFEEVDEAIRKLLGIKNPPPSQKLRNPGTKQINEINP